VYRADLAHIHHEGFSEFAEQASLGILEILWKQGVRGGLVVDAGCGSGVLARELTRAGFDVLGFDPSPAMIALARTTAPAARFEVASLATAALPQCVAITAVGEVLNYASLDEVKEFFRKAASVCRLLVFDIAERGSYPPNDERRVDGDDWTVIAAKESDGRTLTRRVITFRAEGETMRRDEETHTLELYGGEQIAAALRELGFRVRRRRSYGSYRLPKGHAVYVAVR
jgi:SAM-dependent methyltransferase